MTDELFKECRLCRYWSGPELQGHIPGARPGYRKCKFDNLEKYQPWRGPTDGCWNWTAKIPNEVIKNDN